MSGVYTIKEVRAGELKHGELFQDEYKTLYQVTGKVGNEIEYRMTRTADAEVKRMDVGCEVYRLDIIELDPAEEIAKQMGGVPPVYTEDPLVVLLYLLMRDHLGGGVFERLVNEMATNMPASLTNRYLAFYADNIARRLKQEGDNDVVAHLEAQR